MIATGRCGCGPGACLCAVNGSVTNCATVTVTGDGSSDFPYIIGAVPIFDPVTINCLNCGPSGIRLVISPTVGNQLTCSANGLLVPAAAAPVSGTTAIATADTNCIDLSGDGTGGSPLSADPIISPTAGNQLTCTANGLYAAPPVSGSVGIVTTDSGSVDFSGDGTAGSPLTAVTIAGGHTHDGTGGGTSLVVGGVNEAGGTVPTSTSLQSIAIGDFANASTGTQPIAIGSGTNAISAPSATGQGGIAIGASNGAAIAGARASGTNSVAIGSGSATLVGALAGGAQAVAVGHLANASTTYTTAIGGFASASAAESTAVGASAIASAVRSLAVGNIALASITDGVAVGMNAQAITGSQTIAIGAGSNTTAGPLASAQGAIAIGASGAAGIVGARASGASAIAIGSGDGSNVGALASGGDSSIAIGRTSRAIRDTGIAIGAYAIADSGTSSHGSIAIGGGGNATFSAQATGNNSIAIGQASVVGGSVGARASTTGAVAIGGSVGSGGGQGADSSGFGGVAVGAISICSAFGGVALGLWARSVTPASHSVAVGQNAGATTAAQTIALGGGNTVTAAPLASAQGAIAIGGSNGDAIAGARSSGVCGVAIGGGTATGGGIGALASSTGSVAIGGAVGASPGASATHSNAIVFGHGTASSNTDQVNIGIKRLFAGVPGTAPADADLVNSQVSFWVDEAGGLLTFKVKYSTGGVVSGTVALA